MLVGVEKMVEVVIFCEILEWWWLERGGSGEKDEEVGRRYWLSDVSSGSCVMGIELEIEIEFMMVYFFLFFMYFNVKISFFFVEGIWEK